MTKKTIALFIFALLASLAACSRSAAEEPRTISVKGSAELVIPSDQVIIDIVMTTQNADPGKAQAQNDEKVKKVLAYLESLAIPPADISTNYVQLNRKEAELENKPPLFLGYEASNRLIIVLKEMNKYDQLIPGLLRAGVDRIDGFRFDSSKIRETLKQARIAAIQAAKNKADYLTAELGQKVGVPITIEPEEEDRNDSRSNSLSYYVPPDSVQIQTMAPSMIRVRADVRVKFKILDR